MSKRYWLIDDGGTRFVWDSEMRKMFEKSSGDEFFSYRNKMSLNKLLKFRPGSMIVKQTDKRPSGLPVRTQAEEKKRVMGT